MASDIDWRPQWRVDLIPSYKAHRVEEPVPPALIPQMQHIEAILGAIGVDFVGARALEAEDVIASWVEQLTGYIEIVSGDRDLFALIRDPDVTVLYPERGGLARIDEAEVTRRYGIPGVLYGDFAVLRGDPSDGLPGLKGIGPASAASMVRRYGGLDGLLASGALSEDDARYVQLARSVVKPGSETPVSPPQGTRPQWPVDKSRLDELVAQLPIAHSVNRLLQALAR